MAERPGIRQSTTEELLNDAVGALWDVQSAIDQQTKVLEEHTLLLRQIKNNQ